VFWDPVSQDLHCWLYVHGRASTPVITVTTLNAEDATTTLRQIADTIKFS
jgi:hypothetical protein